MVTEPSQRSGKFVRALSFGSVAERYERYRLGYPNELLDAVLRYVERPVCTALEIGAGTGRQRGCLQRVASRSPRSNPTPTW